MPISNPRLSPESPRLLLIQEKIEKAEQIIRKMKKINGEEIPEGFSDELRTIAQEISKEKSFGMTSLVKSKRMLYILFLFAITW